VTPSRVLIVRLGALGDVVHAIPVAAALRRAFPQARIDWLVSAKHREILDLVPVIDRRLVINDRSDASGGASMVAAIDAIRKRNPARIVGAVPIASLDTCEAIGERVDEMLCLYTPDRMYAVGVWYEDFTQTTDVIERIEEARRRKQEAGD